MTTKELLAGHEELLEDLHVGHRELLIELLETVAKKNNDYAPTDNAFSNFMLGELAGIGTVEKGFVFRMLDKFGRLSSFLKTGILKVKDESITDTLLDLANYCLLLILYIKWKRGQE